MDDTADPILNFFSEKEAEDDTLLYKALDLEPSCSAEDIKKAYRRQALKYHPDKHVSKAEDEKEKLAKGFQRVGFAYAVLSDEGRRKRYDQTGRTDENQFADAEAMGWDAYFDSLWQRVDRKMLDDHKKQYQGSKEEEEDLIEAYNAASGSLPKMMESIPHSAHPDEPRFVERINALIAAGTLKSTKKWLSSSTDKAASSKRRKAGEREAKEAEEMAKQLGVHDEFYGSGSKGKRQGEGSKGKGTGEGAGEDALQALILKRQKDRAGAMDSLEEKYRRIEEEERARKKAKKGKKSRQGDDEENEAPPDPLDDAAFEKLQAEMFAKKGEDVSAKKGRKAKT